MTRGATLNTFRRLIAAALLAGARSATGQEAPIPVASPPSAPAEQGVPNDPQAAIPPAPPADDSDGAGNAQPDPDDLPGAVVLLNNGQRITGMLVERDKDHIVLLVGNIRMDLPIAQVDRVDLQPTVAQQYENMRRMISPKDLPQRIMLASWLFDKERYDWALKEVNGVLDEDPANPDALRLRRLIVCQLDLRARAGQARPEPRPQADKPPKFQFPLLTPEQINLMKVYELDLSAPPKMIVPREAIDRILKEYADSDQLPPTPEGREALYHRAPADVLELMFRLHARDLYGMVQVQDQPRSMALFRDDVQQSWLINSCATDRCHGGAEAGRLRLYNRRPNGDATVYTDFLILDRFRLADDRPLINYEEPAQSPLLQMALPRENSLFPHPKVPGSNGRGDVWKPALPSTTDKRFGRALDWIKSMYQPRPDYPIVYEPPGSSLPRADAAAPAQPR